MRISETRGETELEEIISNLTIKYALVHFTFWTLRKMSWCKVRIKRMARCILSMNSIVIISTYAFCILLYIKLFFKGEFFLIYRKLLFILPMTIWFWLIQMNVILGRNLIPIALNTYLPSTLLVIISYVTVFFKPFFFEAVVTVNLTTLLVLVTLFVSVSISCD